MGERMNIELVEQWEAEIGNCKDDVDAMWDELQDDDEYIRSLVPDLCAIYWLLDTAHDLITGIIGNFSTED